MRLRVQEEFDECIRTDITRSCEVLSSNDDISIVKIPAGEDELHVTVKTDGLNVVMKPDGLSRCIITFERENGVPLYQEFHPCR